jgi:hypothetical protein
VLHVTVHFDRFVATLLDAGLLSPEEALDRHNLEQAAAAILDEWVCRWAE